jgi:hypothetical protein
LAVLFNSKKNNDKQQRFECLKVLLSYGADPRRKHHNGTGDTPLEWLRKQSDLDQGQEKCKEYLEWIQAYENKPDDKLKKLCTDTFWKHKQTTKERVAQLRKMKEVLETNGEAGSAQREAYVNQLSSKGTTALFCLAGVPKSCTDERLSGVKLLLENGAWPNIRTDSHNYPLFKAVWYAGKGGWKICEALLKHGAMNAWHQLQKNNLLQLKSKSSATRGPFTLEQIVMQGPHRKELEHGYTSWLSAV